MIAGHIWSSSVSLTIIKRLMFLEDKAPCYSIDSNEFEKLLVLLSVMADKLLSEEGSEHPIQELTNPVPIDDSGSSVEAVLGKNPDVHYIYVCTKTGTLVTD
uniref:Uncharacterized protein n=1 Tax=Salix viminalis TaxID=40686 RepID=A0A6N2NI41_SALVM